MFTPYLAGLLFGDGTCYRGNYGVWIDQVKRNLFIVEEAKKELEALKFKVHYYGYLNKQRALVYSKDLYYEFISLRENPVKFFESLTKDQKKKFIAGLFDAEGTVTDRLVLYNGDLILLKHIRKFLKNNNIPSYIYKFGKIYGVQIYRREDIKKVNDIIPSLKLKNSILPS